MHRFLPVLLLLFSTFIYGQIDQRKVDSLSKSIDSSAKAVRAHQDSLIKFQDSTYKAEVTKALDQNSGLPDRLLAEQKRREAKERQQALPGLIGAALLAIAIMAWLRRRKTKV